MILQELLNFRVFWFWCLVCFPWTANSQAIPSDLIINEILAVNGSAYPSEDRGIVTFPDVIELYNRGSSAINLSGYYLSDDPANPLKWEFPRTFIQPNTYQTILATGGGSSQTFGPLETNFRLSDEGESLLLSAPDQTLIQQIDFPRQISNFSWGRRANGTFAYYRPASIGEDNDDDQSFDTLVARPRTDQESGFYQDSLTVTLSAEPGFQIRFTTDGTQPNESSSLYSAALVFTETTVLKSITVGPSAQSDVASRTFIFGENPHELPVAIFTADSLRYDRSVNATHGSYFLDGRVRFDLVETDGSLPISQYVEFQRSGLSSRIIPPFNGKIYARDRLGPSRLRHQFFTDKEEDSFERLLFRNTSQDFDMARMRDAVISRFIGDGDIVESPHEGYRPVVVYLNGEYVGHMNIREDDDMAFVRQYYNLDTPVAPNRSFDGFGDFFANHVPGPFNDPDRVLADPNSADAIFRLNELIDVDEAMLDSVVRRAFDVAEGTTFWTSSTAGQPSRTSLHDYDFSLNFGLPSNIGTRTWGSDVSFNLFDRTIRPAEPSFVLRFQQEALQHAAAFNQHMGYVGRIGAIVDNVATELRAEMPRTIAYYRSLEVTGASPLGTNDNPIVQNLAEWEDQVRFLRGNAVALVGPSATTDLGDRLGFDTVDVDVVNSDRSMGEVRVHGYRVLPGRERGQYFADTPLRLEAQPFPGYAFAGWTGDVPLVVNEATDPVVEVSFAAGSTPRIQANFVVTPLTLAISEIHYNPEGMLEDEEFLELVNFGSEEIDIGGVNFTDGIGFTFPDGTLLGPGEFITLRPDVIAGPLRYSGRLRNSGEMLVFNDPAGTELESLRYDDEVPWPLAADGLGHSLVRLSPGNDDPSSPASWRVSAQPGGNSDASDSLPLTDSSPEGLLNYAFGRSDPSIDLLINEDGTFSLSYTQVVNADAVAVQLVSSIDLTPGSWVPIDAALLSSDSLPQAGSESITLGAQPLDGEARFYRLEISVR